MADIVVVGGAEDPNGCPSGSSYALVAEEGTYLLDCGETCGARLRRYGVDPLAVRAVLISHMHYDHLAGLFGFLTAVWMACRREEEIPPGVQEWAARSRLPDSALPRSLTIAVPEEGVSPLKAFLPAVYLAPEVWHLDLRVQGIGPGVCYEDDLVQVRAYPNRHLAGQLAYSQLPRLYPWLSLESYTFLVEVNGLRIVYSGDLAPLGQEGVEELSPVARQADLLIVEAAHVPPEPLMRMLASTEARQILLVHVHPGLKGRLDAYLKEHPDERFVRARNGMRLPLR